MAFHGYKEVEHTADIALRVWGEDFPTLLQQAADGLYALMGIKPVGDATTVQFFTIPQGTPETILVDFLGELLYQAEADDLVLGGFNFIVGQDAVSVWSIGRKILSQEMVFKAVTFHNLTVEDTESGMIATITFDV